MLAKVWILIYLSRSSLHTCLLPQIRYIRMANIETHPQRDYNVSYPRPTHREDLLAHCTPRYNKHIQRRATQRLLAWLCKHCYHSTYHLREIVKGLRIQLRNVPKQHVVVTSNLFVLSCIVLIQAQANARELLGVLGVNDRISSTSRRRRSVFTTLKVAF